MSYSIHAYFLEEQINNQDFIFDSIKSIFSKSERVEFTITENRFTRKNFLKLTVDKSYSISAFFDKDLAVAVDLEFILKKQLKCDSRLRFLFAPDPENDFDDIGVIILDYLESFKKVLIYSVNQEKVIFFSDKNE